MALVKDAAHNSKFISLFYVKLPLITNILEFLNWSFIEDCVGVGYALSRSG